MSEPALQNFESQNPLNLGKLLHDRADALKGRPKRTRTRTRILAVTAQEMERVGYEGLTVDGIVKEAGIGRGTFYLYYPNKAEVAKAVFRRYSVFLRLARPRRRAAGSLYESIHNYNTYYVAFYAANAMLLAGREALMRDAPEMAIRRDLVNEKWASKVLRNAGKRSGHSEIHENPRISRLLVRSAIAMVDELLREIYIHQSPTLSKLAHNQKLVVDLISLAWFRTLYGESPPGFDMTDISA